MKRSTAAPRSRRSVPQPVALRRPTTRTPAARAFQTPGRLRAATAPGPKAIVSAVPLGTPPGALNREALPVLRPRSRRQRRVPPLLHRWVPLTYLRCPSKTQLGLQARTQLGIGTAANQAAHGQARAACQALCRRATLAQVRDCQMAASRQCAMEVLRRRVSTTSPSWSPKGCRWVSLQLPWVAAMA